MSAVCFYDTVFIENIYIPLLKWQQNPEEPRPMNTDCIHCQDLLN